MAKKNKLGRMITFSMQKDMPWDRAFTGYWDPGVPVSSQLANWEGIFEDILIGGIQDSLEGLLLRSTLLEKNHA